MLVFCGCFAPAIFCIPQYLCVTVHHHHRVSYALVLILLSLISLSKVTEPPVAHILLPDLSFHKAGVLYRAGCNVIGSCLSWDSEVHWAFKMGERGTFVKLLFFPFPLACIGLIFLMIPISMVWDCCSIICMRASEEA